MGDLYVIKSILIDSITSDELTISKKDMQNNTLSQINFGRDPANLNGEISFKTIDDGFPSSALVNRLNIHINGYVGIGTDKPKLPLHIPEGGLQVGTSPDAYNNFYLVNEKEDVPSLNSRTFRLYHRGESDHLLTVASLGGRVGIGTKTPQNKLDVEGNAVIGTTYAGIQRAPDNGLLVEGNVGIGTTDPKTKLSVGGSGEYISGSDAWIENNMHVQGSEPLNQGGRGRLRVGTAWYYTGIYSEPSSSGALNDLVLGASSGNVRIGPDWGGQNLYVNGDIYYGQLNKLDVADNFNAVVRAADFYLGHSGRRGSPGRALVDKGNKLVINYDGDWKETIIHGDCNLISSREVKEDISDLSDQRAFEILNELNPVEFNFKADNEKQRRVGFIAETVPGLVGTSDNKAVNPLGILGILTKIIKRQQKAILNLEKINNQST